MADVQRVENKGSKSAEEKEKEVKQAQNRSVSDILGLLSEDSAPKEESAKVHDEITGKKARELGKLNAHILPLYFFPIFKIFGGSASAFRIFQLSKLMCTTADIWGSDGGEEKKDASKENTDELLDMFLVPSNN